MIARALSTGCFCLIGFLIPISSAFGVPRFGAIAPESSPASDAFAAAHLALIFIVFLGFAVFAWVLYRRGKSPNQEREFIEDLQEEQQRDATDKRKSSAGADSDEPREPWEQSEDWWKKE